MSYELKQTSSPPSDEVRQLLHEISTISDSIASRKPVRICKIDGYAQLLQEVETKYDLLSSASELDSLLETSRTLRSQMELMVSIHDKLKPSSLIGNLRTVRDKYLEIQLMFELQDQTTKIMDNTPMETLLSLRDGLSTVKDISGMHDHRPCTNEDLGVKSDLPTVTATASEQSPTADPQRSSSVKQQQSEQPADNRTSRWFIYVAGAILVVVVIVVIVVLYSTSSVERLMIDDRWSYPARISTSHALRQSITNFR
jgi:uncharacterized integral membrane protein